LTFEPKPISARKKMMMMEEEEDMEIEEPLMFVAHEIDLDYEFDAVRFFDFSVQETPDQALQAQQWFQSAVSYPPSRPFNPLFLPFFHTSS